MAAKPKRPVSYDLKKQDRRRNVLIQIGLVVVVVLFAAGLLSYIVISNDKPDAGEARAVRVAAPNVITQEGTTEPKAVLSLYEDFLCPACGQFERQLGPKITSLIQSGAIAVDYHMVSILDRAGDGYSSRAGAAAYCVADESNEAFARFHQALYTPSIQPAENSGVYPDDARLIELARLAGAAGTVPECVSSGKYIDMVKGMAAAAEINSTPTVRLNGQEIEPAQIEAKVKEIVGDVPAAPANPAAP